jgi:hypothetical protein
VSSQEKESKTPQFHIRVHSNRSLTLHYSSSKNYPREMARAIQHTSTLDPTILTANILAEHPFPSAAAFGADWIA